MIDVIDVYVDELFAEEPAIAMSSVWIVETLLDAHFKNAVTNRCPVWLNRVGDHNYALCHTVAGIHGV